MPGVIFQPLFMSGGSWQTLVTPTLNSNQGNGAAEAIRSYIGIAAYSATTPTGSKIRVTFTPPTSGSSPTISAVWVGHPGTAPNFDGNQVQLKFSGGTSLTLTAGGSAVLSDVATFAFDKTKALIVSVADDVWWERANASIGPNYIQYAKAGDGANAGTTSVSGYSTTSGFIDNGIGLVEIFG